jgi:hypothetical protein
MVVAHEIRRPWPSRSGFSATGNRKDGVRWKIRRHHTHVEDSALPGMCGGCEQPMTSVSKWFPWWKPSSYSAFWRLAGRDFYWPPVVTIWHVEPGGRDGLTVCSRRYQDKAGKWHYTRGWRWHVHHFKLQVQPLQHLRRWALTRCGWCGGRSVKGDVVNCSASWDGEKSRWWQGERGLFHGDCLGRSQSWGTCVCDTPVLREHGTGTMAWGKCGACGRFRPYGIKIEALDRARLVQSQGKGSR